MSKLLSIGVLLSVLTFSLGQKVNIDRCPSNILRNGDLFTHRESCYEFVVSKHLYWRMARDYCAHNGGKLVKISNMEEQLFIVNVLRHLGFRDKGIWIGLNDIVTEGSYVWADGTPLSSFNFWAPGEPSLGHNFEDCVGIKMSSNGHWHDFACSLFLDEFSMICQYNMLPASTLDPNIILGTQSTTTTKPVIIDTPVFGSTNGRPIVNTTDLIIG